MSQPPSTQPPSTRPPEPDLVGAWRLQRAVMVFDDGEHRDEFGPAADGYLSYSPNGIVSAVLGDLRRPVFVAGDPRGGTPTEYTGAAARFIAYAGPYTVEKTLGAAGGTVTHHIDIALFPNWQGEAQPRRYAITGSTTGSTLTITASPRHAPDGRTFHSDLVWTRTVR